MEKELLKKILEEMQYQTKLLETMIEGVDASRKHGQKKAEEMKSQTMDMFKGMFGNHPAMQKILQAQQQNKINDQKV